MTSVERPIQRRQRQRNPVPPAFTLPPRGIKCINWLPFAKRELKLRAKSLNQQRSSVIEMIINNVITIIFTSFALVIESIDISFKLKTDDIVDGLIAEFESKLLRSWDGPQFRSDSWKTKKWEGKNGYYKLCKNWSDQNKSKIAHKYWIPIFDQLLSFIDKICFQIYSQNQTLRNGIKSVLIYSCFYTICSSKIGFPKTRALPLFLDTAMTKNGEIRRYLKALDAKIHIFQFKEEESEKFNRERKICQAVKKRCIQYIGSMVQQKFDTFYQLINVQSNENIFDLQQLQFTIVFDTNGQIGRNQQSKTCNNNNNDNYNNDAMDQDDSKTEQLPMPTIPAISSSAASLPPSLHSSLPSIQSISATSAVSDNTNNSYLGTECDGLSIAYGAYRGQTSHVEQARYTPFGFVQQQTPRMYNNNNQFQLAQQLEQPLEQRYQYQPEHECCCNTSIYNNNNNNNTDYLYDGDISHDISAESASSSISYNSANNISGSYTSVLSTSPYISEYDGYRNGGVNQMNQPNVYNTYCLNPNQNPYQWTYTVQSYAPRYQFN